MIQYQNTGIGSRSLVADLDLDMHAAVELTRGGEGDAYVRAGLEPDATAVEDRELLEAGEEALGLTEGEPAR